MSLHKLNSFILLSAMVFTVGCTPSDIGTVTGTVTADGQPLPGALIEFYPKAGGGSSQARTDEDGKYELIRDRETMGAAVGEHEVRISTFGSVETGDYGKESPETLPAKYNLKSELLETVNPGRNVIDFELDFDGPVIQPPTTS